MSHVPWWAVMAPLVLLVAGCAAPEAEGSTAVEIDDNYFEYAGTKNGDATARAGDSIVFVSEGRVDHTVTVHRPPDPLTEFLKDEVVHPEGQTSFAFDRAGTYHVWCSYHGEMTSGMHITFNVA